MTTTRRPGTAAAAMVALCLALGACSGGASSAAPTPSRASTGSPGSSGESNAAPSSAASPTPGAAGDSSATRPAAESATPAGGTAASSGSGSLSSSAPAEGTGIQLPRGGRTIFPRYRLVGYSGAPGSKAFGRLGVGDIDKRVDEIERRATAYRAGREVLPVLELITYIANASPGPDGDYNSRVGDAVIRRYLDAARRHHALLLLDVQPGRADFLTLVRQLRPWLEQPDVGLALDPEWAVEPGQRPGQVFGRTTGKELDSVAKYLDALASEKGLPQKVMVFHQVAASVVRHQDDIQERPGVVVVKSVDGIGSRAMKTDTWRVLVRHLPPSIHTGFKMFFDEDTRHGALMTPKQVLALRPRPEYVLYE